MKMKTKANTCLFISWIAVYPKLVSKVKHTYVALLKAYLLLNENASFNA